MLRINRVKLIAGLAALAIGSLATSAMAQCAAPGSASGGLIPRSGSDSFAASSSSASSGASFGGSFSSASAVGLNSRSSQSQAASGPLTGNEPFTTPFGISGYQGFMASQNAAFYRFAKIQKSADTSVRRSNRARSDERLAQRRAMRAAKKAATKTGGDSYVNNR